MDVISLECAVPCRVRSAALAALDEPAIASDLASIGVGTLRAPVRRLAGTPAQRSAAMTPLGAALLGLAIIACGSGAVIAAPHFSLPPVAVGGALGVLSLLTFGSIFVGSLAAGLCGFAFSAITGALLFHWLPPVSAVPLLLACSITTQLFSITALWKSMQWDECLPLLLGGLPGIPVGAYVLQHLSAAIFAVGFGVFLVGYAGYSLWRPATAVVRRGGRAACLLAGFLGGVTGGAIAFPGAIPTIWCSLRAMPKDAQRGTVQPFILLMQLATLLYFSRIGILAGTTAATFLWCLPAVIAGTWIGVRLYRRLNDQAYRRVLLYFLLLAGAMLIV